MTAGADKLQMVGMASKLLLHRLALDAAMLLSPYLEAASSISQADLHLHPQKNAQVLRTLL